MNSKYDYIFSNRVPLICNPNGKIKLYQTITITITVLLLAFTVADQSPLSSELAQDTQAFAQNELIGSTTGNNTPNTDIFNLTLGYKIEPVVWNLTAPDSLTFDRNGTMYIAEAGYPFTHVPKVPRILKVSPSGNISVFADKNLNSPIVDIVAYNETALYVSHNHKISIINLKNGEVKDIIGGLPTNLVHQNNQIAFSPDGKRLYVGIGSATNSGVVGVDDHQLGWLPNQPEGRDIPGKNITLTGQNFVSENPLTAELNDSATTGAFVPFGRSTYAGQVIPGDEKCNGCIISANLNGTDLKVEGWGFRNPTGLAFNEEGRLFAVNHGADQRGSRPIANDSDKLNEVNLNETGFYGWPDFFGNAEPVTNAKFLSPRGEDKPLQFLLQNHPPVQKPFLLFKPLHASGIQITFANDSFGFPGEAFVAQVGTDAPISRPLPPPGTIIGQNIVRVNIDNKTITEFLTLNNSSRIFRPTDVVFGPGGSSLYVVDWGHVSFTEGTALTTPNTGTVWKITKTIKNQ